MYITRNLVAKLLETKPNNIKSLKQVEGKIYIELGDCEDELFMMVEEYQNCLKQLKRNKEHINRTNFVTIMAILSFFVFVTMLSAKSNLANYENLPTTPELSLI